jgi:DNA-binding PadR family transcriptional regulator
MTVTTKKNQNGKDTFVSIFNFKDMEHIISPLQHKIIDLLQKRGAMSRKELIDNLPNKKNGKAQSRTTVYDNLMRLAKYGFIKKFPRPRNDVGRPTIYFKLNDNSEK